MNLLSAGRSLSAFVTRNSTTILTTIAVTGVITTAGLAAEGHLRASRVRYATSDNWLENLWSACKARGLYYTPALLSGAVTIGSIIWSAKIGSKKIAALTVAYAASEKSLLQFKENAYKLLDDKQKDQLEEKIARDSVSTSVSKPNTVIVEEGKSLCLDSYSGRYFSATKEDIRRAVNDVNRELLSNDFASLNDFYSALGLETLRIGDALGWNVDDICDVDFSSTLTEDGKPCIVVKFNPDPFPGWWTRTRY